MSIQHQSIKITTTHSIQQNLQQPLKISNNHSFGITPFGVYCLECCVPIGNLNNKALKDSLRMHIHRRKHSITGNSTPSYLLKMLQHEISNRFGNEGDYSAWIRKRNIKTYQCTCGVSIKNSGNKSRHIKIAQKNKPDVNHTIKCLQSVLTVCGRIVHEDTITKMIKVPVSE